MYDYTSGYGSSSDENNPFVSQNSGEDSNNYSSDNESNSENAQSSSSQSSNMKGSESQSSGAQNKNSGSQSKKSEENLSVLNEIYQISVMGKQAISTIIPKVEDEDFKKELISSYENYEDICSKSSSEIMKMGEKPREKNPLTKAMLWGSVNVTSIVDSSPSSLANVIIKGSHNGISSMTRALNQHSGNIDENVKKLADSYLKKEESNIDGLQKYL